LESQRTQNNTQQNNRCRRRWRRKWSSYSLILDYFLFLTFLESKLIFKKRRWLRGWTVFVRAVVRRNCVAHQTEKGRKRKASFFHATRSASWDRSAPPIIILYVIPDVMVGSTTTSLPRGSYWNTSHTVWPAIRSQFEIGLRNWLVALPRWCCASVKDRSLNKYLFFVAI
jgi:hypothetical protein